MDHMTSYDSINMTYSSTGAATGGGASTGKLVMLALVTDADKGCWRCCCFLLVGLTTGCSGISSITGSTGSAGTTGTSTDPSSPFFLRDTHGLYWRLAAALLRGVLESSLDN